MDNDKQMFDVNLSCAECSKAITKLPFQPSSDRPVYCSDCLRARRESRPERKMHEVDLNCAECGAHITQLPFQPSEDRPVYCRDCNKTRRSA